MPEEESNSLFYRPGCWDEVVFLPRFTPSADQFPHEMNVRFNIALLPSAVIIAEVMWDDYPLVSCQIQIVLGRYEQHKVYFVHWPPGWSLFHIPEVFVEEIYTKMIIPQIRNAGLIEEGVQFLLRLN